MVEETEITNAQLMHSVLSMGENVAALTDSAAAISASVTALEKTVQANHKEVKDELAAIRAVVDNQLAGQKQVDGHDRRLRYLEKSR